MEILLRTIIPSTINHLNKSVCACVFIIVGFLRVINFKHIIAK